MSSYTFLDVSYHSPSRNHYNNNRQNAFKKKNSFYLSFIDVSIINTYRLLSFLICTLRFVVLLEDHRYFSQSILELVTQFNPAHPLKRPRFFFFFVFTTLSRVILGFIPKTFIDFVPLLRVLTVHHRNPDHSISYRTIPLFRGWILKTHCKGSPVPDKMDEGRFCRWKFREI